MKYEEILKRPNTTTIKPLRIFQNNQTIFLGLLFENPYPKTG